MARKRRPAFAGVLLLATLVGLSGRAPALAGEADAQAALFGTSETRSANIQIFPKWTGTLERYYSERGLADLPCESSAFNRCHLAEWARFVDGQRGRDRMDQIIAINSYMNRQRYIVDPRNYGVRDYWATPHQFLSRNGDCEDYAIAKFMSLRDLGFRNEDLRIVVLQDLNLGIAHAILVVYLDGRPLVLDNQIKDVVPADAVYHYQPYYSINESYWWLHQAMPTRIAL